MDKYKLIVGNIGSVYSGDDRAEADRLFEVYKGQSDSLVGRAGGEDVTLFEDGEPVQEHTGKLNEQDM